MTKNELTRLLGIDVLMKRNAKSKVFNTMLDILCDFLVITKEATNGEGVSYPTTSRALRICFERASSVNELAISVVMDIPAKCAHFRER